MRPWTAVPPQPGRRFVITGANSGVGFQVARILGSRGAEVVLACRNLEKGEAAARQVPGHDAGRVTVRRLDVADLGSVREFAEAFLTAGAHVLVEKPITETPQQARKLIARAAERKRILQVGHLERFNSAILAAEPHISSPRFMECHRLAPFKERGTDVNVVLDLMIHDIDLVQSLTGSEIVSIDAVGSPVFSGEIDIANARIRFANGCVANTTASRVSLKTERKLRIFEDAAYISLDLQQKILTLIRKRTEPPQAGHLPVSIEEANLEQGDALKSEIESFLDCIRNDRRPIVSGEDGLRALETAIRITEQVHANLPGGRKPA